MDGVPAKCPTCSTAIPAGRVRCPGCGRVFGEDNRCPNCNAIAAVRQSGGEYLCLACSKPRERLPNTVVLGEDGRSSIVPAILPGTPARSGLRELGAATMFASLLAAGAVVGAVGTGALGVALALVVIGFGAGGLLWRAAAARAEASRREALRVIEQRVLTLAESRGGDLTVTDVARALKIAIEDADAALTHLADGTRVTAEIDESAGVLHFVFHEVQRALPKTRVEVDESPEAESAGQEAEAPASKRAERAQ